MIRRPTHRPRDDGIATVWAAAAAAVIVAALLLGLHLGAAVAARHRAEAAADLAALAAAGHAVHGAEAACRRAEVIAERMGAAVARCLLSEWDALVEVHVAVPLALPGTADAVGRARAGPAEPDPAGTPATSAAPPHPGLVQVGAPAGVGRHRHRPVPSIRPGSWTGSAIR
ncbi:Rv3654c family TadE-like protein [Pseudonocardia xinjiangensis]|uniref:Rv3654c family TadE-like protein n=1 Tax=Pseudonocardia xinjiangensis TaxID=75289 RepID=UPI003D92E81C